MLQYSMCLKKKSYEVHKEKVAFIYIKENSLHINSKCQLKPREICTMFNSIKTDITWMIVKNWWDLAMLRNIK